MKKTHTKKFVLAILMISSIVLIAASINGLKNDPHPAYLVEFIFAIILVLLRDSVKRGIIAL